MIRPYSVPQAPDLFVGANSSAVAYAASTGQPTLAQTLMAVVRVSAVSPAAIGYFFTNGNTGALSGVRFGQNSSGSGVAWIFGSDSSGTAGSPAVGTTTTAAALNTTSTYTVFGTWDGTLNGSGINIYTAVDGANVALDINTPTSGTGSINTSAGQIMAVGNRTDLGTARAFSGSIALMARWNRVLTLTEMNIAKFYGPLMLRNGLVLCRMGRRDYGAYNLTPTTVQALSPGGFMQYVPPVQARLSQAGTIGFTGAAATYPGGRVQLFG